MMTRRESAPARVSNAGRPVNWRFSKMHGAGNDFIVLDLRNGRAPPAAEECRWLADRRLGIGCDQILTIEPPRTHGALAAYRIFNADGSASGQCGNGARCVAEWLVRAGMVPVDDFVLDSPVGTHAVKRLGAGEWQVAMGRPDFAPARIPLVGVDAEQPGYTFTLADGTRIEAGALSMGNPHAVVEVAAVDCAPVATWGRSLQETEYFPESVNVGFAEVIDSAHVRLRVFERGAGETLACGSGACAAAAWLMRRGRVARAVAVEMRGGTLRIHWPGDADDVLMRGPATFVFEGHCTP